MCELHRVGELNCVRKFEAFTRTVGIIYLRIHEINRIIEIQIMPCVSLKNLVADIMQLELV